METTPSNETQLRVLVTDAWRLWDAADREARSPQTHSESTQLVLLHEQLIDALARLARAHEVTQKANNAVSELRQVGAYLESIITSRTAELNAAQERARAEIEYQIAQAQRRLERTESELERAQRRRYTAEQAQQAFAREAHEAREQITRLEEKADLLYGRIEPVPFAVARPDIRLKNLDDRLDRISDNGALEDQELSGLVEDVQFPLSADPGGPGPQIVQGFIVQQRTGPDTDGPADHSTLSITTSDSTRASIASRSMHVLVLDDNARTAISSLRYFTSDLPGHEDRFHLTSLADPARLDAHLDAHPEINVVLVDATFERSGHGRTCLAIFDSLINRNGPKGIGLVNSQVGASLFPFAVCQLLPPPRGQIIAGWTRKVDSDKDGYPEVIRILDEIASGCPLYAPRTLRNYMPVKSNGWGNNFIEEILSSHTDVKLWKLLSEGHYTISQLAQHSNVSTRTIQARFARYSHAIQMLGNLGSFNDSTKNALASHGERNTREPVQRIIEVFAQTHRNLFQAPELQGIVARKIEITRKGKA
ncbi:hypothetical protein ACIF6H_37115 [Streptomyces microflavus]|uniref:hypothetical protein n=1 Tax=Streptomyces microflavus TaxID=1919 RepID=UPI003436BE1A